ncbi:hypothetical protein pb186bvf_002962 [Paramecium bursaria]
MIFILIICVYALDIHFKLPRRDIRCFSDRLQQEEILTGKVISDSSTFSLKIVDSETSKQLHYTFNDNQQEFKIVPTKATSIQFCIHNMDNFVISINLVYETGNAGIRLFKGSINVRLRRNKTIYKSFKQRYQSFKD